MTAVAWPAQRALAARARPRRRPAGRVARPGPARPRAAPPHRRARRPPLDSLTRGRAPAWGAAIAVPGRAHHPPPRRPGRPPPHPAPRAGPPRAARGGAGARPALVRRGLRRLGRRRMGAARRRSSSTSPWCAGRCPTLTGLDGALRGSASTADAAYALAVSAVTELARRNPTGTLDPLLARLEAGEDFDAAVLATTGLTHRPVRGGVAARRPAAVHSGQLADRGRRVAGRRPRARRAGPAPAPGRSGAPGRARRWLGRGARNRGGA